MCNIQMIKEIPTDKYFSYKKVSFTSGHIHTMCYNESVTKNIEKLLISSLKEDEGNAGST